MLRTHDRYGNRVDEVEFDDSWHHLTRAGIERVYGETHETNSTGRRLYDQVAKHHGFIVYARDVA